MKQYLRVVVWIVLWGCGGAPVQSSDAKETLKPAQAPAMANEGALENLSAPSQGMVAVDVVDVFVDGDGDVIVVLREQGARRRLADRARARTFD